MGERDGLFDTFAEAQSHLLSILKAEHAQAVADISRLSIELTVIEAKIRSLCQNRPLFKNSIMNVLSAEIGVFLLTRYCRTALTGRLNEFVSDTN